VARSVAGRAEIVPVLAEIFREHGFEGASLALIGARTGLGKGSLYHFFPGGKEEMAEAVLAEIAAWFEDRIYRPLRAEPDPRRAIRAMCDAVLAYFHSGRRICLVGAFALDATRERFASQIRHYFVGWIAALAAALERAGCAPATARVRAEAAVGEIQGALVLARALDDPAVFARGVAWVSEELEQYPIR
jgi:TetR/AcrR family transcriptional regulator, lmrAB and yxaGH operons repressor